MKNLLIILMFIVSGCAIGTYSYNYDSAKLVLSNAFPNAIMFEDEAFPNYYILIDTTNNYVYRVTLGNNHLGIKDIVFLQQIHRDSIHQNKALTDEGLLGGMFKTDKMEKNLKKQKHD